MRDLVLYYATIFLKTLFVFFSPINGIIILVALSTILDTIFGLWRAKKLKEKITSKKARFGLVPKLVSYVGAIMLVYASDFFIINELTLMVVDINFISSKIIALSLIGIEITSIDESYKKVTGVSFLKKITDIIVKGKDIKKNLKK